MSLTDRHAPESQKPSVHVDAQHGHIAVTDERDRTLVLADVGPHLDVWSYQGARLTPVLAAQLGSALTAWGKRHGADERAPVEEFPADLLDLIAAVEREASRA